MTVEITDLYPLFQFFSNIIYWQMLSKVLEIISQLKWPVKFLLKTSRNPWTTAIRF